MAFTFVMKSAHRRDKSKSSSLPAISEDGTDFSFPDPPPPIPALNFLRQQNSGSPLRNSPNSETYTSAFSDTSSTAAATKSGEEKPFGLRDRVASKKSIAKRGGWKRVALIVIIIVLCLVGLIVGLVVGLRKRNSNNEQPWSQTTNSALNSTFPAGHWSITTFLSSVSTNCTSNSQTWRCYPYTTYAQSPSSSQATLDWIVYAFISTSSSTPVYTISSTSNPFSFSFSNVTLGSIQDFGASTERYSFSVPMKKAVIPAAALTNSNIASTCYFNQTVLNVSLYTKMDSTYTNTSSTAFTPYPHAVSIEEVVDSGSNVPDCIDVNGNQIGDFSVSATGLECSCEYMNYGT